MYNLIVIINGYLYKQNMGNKNNPIIRMVFETLYVLVACIYLNVCHL